MILSCLQGHMGQVRTRGGHPPESALCAIGDFCFFAGRPDPALVRQADRPLLVPRPDRRRRALALSGGARLILTCLDQGLLPSWDAHDRRSAALAEKLGYRLDRPYPAYLLDQTGP